MTAAPVLKLFATAGKGMESMLADELLALGASGIKSAPGGVRFEGDQETALRACLWSRIANRILLPLRQFPATNPEQLYAGCAQVDWPALFAAECSFAVDATLSKSKVTHSRYAEQTVKDAIVDQFRHTLGQRPNVDRSQPDLRVNLYLHRDQAILSLDLSGDSLHRRGYRVEAVEAPLKENLAAAILVRAGWPAIAAQGGGLYDPMCGSGTLLIEGAMLAADIAPGLLRERFGFMAWREFNPAVWQRLTREAEYRRQQGLKTLPPIAGSDLSIKAAGIAKANVRAAGLAGHIRIQGKPLNQAAPDPGQSPGLLVTNPPYGERLGEMRTLEPLYAELGTILKQHFADWKATVFTGNTELAFHIALRSHKSYSLYNGALPCKVFNFDVVPARYFEPKATTAPQPKPEPDHEPLRPLQGPWSEGATMFANRLGKNLRKLTSWAKRQAVDCYRVYDADLPEYAVAIDLYQGASRWVHAQEYEAPKSIDADKAQLRLREVLTVIPELLQVDPSDVFLKVRRRQKGASQYQKQDSGGGFHEVREGPCRLLVNFRDYLDTGLFLDHRMTRTMLGQMAGGKRFLNLFAYTGSATVHAALGGAKRSVSVDMSATYTDWARRNFELNGMDPEQHLLVQQNCLEWLQQARKKLWLFDLIFIDPPTFSNSKRMAEVFDVQRDHARLILDAMALLAPNGTLIFSTNARTFKLDQDALASLALEDISRQTLPKDFERNPRIHRCWKISR